ncbi:MAG: TerD family protein [Bacteroidales bacterium]|jgi:tellurium resistance protein TerZ|nr:TerD family protein [Bacteroidales bacterium]
MAINLVKGQRINLQKESGQKLTNFCVGCNWGAITKKTFFGLATKAIDVDLDLSCILFNQQGEITDYIWSPLYNFTKIGLPQGKLDSNDRALHHTGDDRTGDQDGDDGLDNEIITVDLSRVSKEINSIVFFLNIYKNREYEGDFSGIPYASIRMFEGTPSKVNSVFASYNVATKTECVGKRALIMGKLYRHDGEWKFNAIGDAYEDPTIAHTIMRVIKDYSK